MFVNKNGMRIAKFAKMNHSEGNCMGRYNQADLIGYVEELPRITKNNETGDYESALAFIRVVRGARNASDGKRYLTTSKPVIISKNRDMVMRMDTWKLYDVVKIRGILATNFINKTSFCTECDARNRNEGSLTYVNPLEIVTIDSHESLDEARERVKEFLQSSNNMTALGNLGRDPKRMALTTKAGKQIVVCQYPVVLNRLYYEESDPADKTNDFPWVKAYGKHCDSDYFRLKLGSTVFVDGFLQTRHVLKHAVCSSCGARYDWQDNTMEIVPYEVEYLMNTRSLEEAEQEQLARQEQSARDIEAYLAKMQGVEVDYSENPAGEVTDENDL